MGYQPSTRLRRISVLDTTARLLLTRAQVKLGYIVAEVGAVEIVTFTCIADVGASLDGIIAGLLSDGTGNTFQISYNVDSSGNGDIGIVSNSSASTVATVTRAYINSNYGDVAIATGTGANVIVTYLTVGVNSSSDNSEGFNFTEFQLGVDAGSVYEVIDESLLSVDGVTPGIESAFTKLGSANPFNQSLNTSNAASFAGLNVTGNPTAPSTGIKFNGTDSEVDFYRNGSRKGVFGYDTGRVTLYNDTGSYCVCLFDDGNFAIGTNLSTSTSNAFYVNKTTGATTVGGLTVGGGQQVTKVLSATATLNFPSTLAQTNSDLTITVTGAQLGDTVDIGVPHGSVEANSSYFGWVSATDTVTVRFLNAGVLAKDPASGVFRATVWRF